MNEHEYDTDDTVVQPSIESQTRSDELLSTAFRPEQPLDTAPDTSRSQTATMDDAVVPDGLDLTPEHYHTLAVESAISDDMLRAARVRSIRPEQVSELAALGFSEKQQVPGILFPHLSVWKDEGTDEQAIRGYSLRRDVPLVDSKGKESRKYEIPYGQASTIYVPPSVFPTLNDPNVPLYVTEGIKKALSVASYGGSCFSLGGVWNWRGKNVKGGKTTLPDFHELALNGRTVIVVFDNDVMIKTPVRSALDALTSVLRARGALVSWTMLPDAETRKLGVDDFLRENGGNVKKLALYTRHAADVQEEDLLITLPQSDVGNGARFALLFGEKVRWCDERKTWFIYDGVVWDGHPSQAIMGLAVEAAQLFHTRVQALPDAHPGKDALGKFAHALQRHAKLKDMLEQAKPRLPVQMREFDRLSFLLNCRNGTVDLRTGVLRPHDPADLITKVAGCDYRPGETHPAWDRFIQHATAGKDGLAPFIQQAIGYSATGLTSEEKLFMVIGPTRTGKSTFLEATKTALGDYATTANFETFLKQRFSAGGSGPSEDIARLAGVRFVSSSEVDDGREMALALTKQLTGGDDVTARYLHQNSFTFTPQLTLWLVANTEPVIPKDEGAMWERVLRVPFDNEVPPDARDPTLKAQLKDPQGAGPAVLNWIVEGAVAWYRTQHLAVPECVRLSTNDYRDRMDPLADFLEDVCTEGPYEYIRTMTLHKEYLQWAKDAGEKTPLGRQKFAKALIDRGKERVKKEGVWVWQKVGLQQGLGGGALGDGLDFSGEAP